MRDLRALSQRRALDALMKSSRTRCATCVTTAPTVRIKTCIQKQDTCWRPSAKCDEVGTTLGAMQVGLAARQLKEAMKTTRFASLPGHPSRRHAGRRCASSTCATWWLHLLTGFTPYLESRLSADAIFGGSVSNAGHPQGAALATAVVSNTGVNSEGISAACSGREPVRFLQREWSRCSTPLRKRKSRCTDPRTACFYARRALELAVAWAYKHDARSHCRTRTTSRR